MKKFKMNTESLKIGCGLLTELLFIIMIIAIIVSSTTIIITTGIIIYLIRDFENYILYNQLKSSDINEIKF